MYRYKLKDYSQIKDIIVFGWSSHGWIDSSDAAVDQPIDDLLALVVVGVAPVAYECKLLQMLQQLHILADLHYTILIYIASNIPTCNSTRLCSL